MASGVVATSFQGQLNAGEPHLRLHKRDSRGQLEFNHHANATVDLKEHCCFVVRDGLLKLRYVFQAQLSIILVECKPTLDEVGLFIGRCVVVLRILLEQIKAKVVHFDSFCNGS